MTRKPTTRLNVALACTASMLAAGATSNVFADDVTDVVVLVEDVAVVKDVPALYELWAGDDGELSVDEWDAATDTLFGEEDVNLAVARWDTDSNGIITPEEFEQAIANDDLFDTVTR